MNQRTTRNQRAARNQRTARNQRAISSFLGAVGLVGLLLAGGCGLLPSSHFLLVPRSPPYHSGDVRIIRGGRAAPGYLEVGIVEARAAKTLGDEKLLERLKNEARAIGADTLIQVRIDRGDTAIAATGVALRYAPVPKTGAPSQP